MDIEAGDLMISTEARSCHVLEEGEYTLDSEGILGGKQVLFAEVGPYWVKDKSFLGDSGELELGGGPITITMMQRLFSLGSYTRYYGKPMYLLTQENRFVWMIEGTADDIIEVILSDRAHA